MKRTVNITLLFFAAWITLASCDPQTCGTGFIQNNTTGAIYLQMDTSRVDTLAAGNTLSLGPVCGLGAGQTPSMINSYRKVYNNDTLCKKDILMDNNWNSLHPEQYKWEHYFTVTDADF